MRRGRLGRRGGGAGIARIGGIGGIGGIGRIGGFRPKSAASAATVVSAVILLAGCGGGGSQVAPPVAEPPEGAFAAVDARLVAAASEPVGAGLEGFGLLVMDRNGTVAYERYLGDFQPDTDYAIASATKLVTALVLLRLVEQGLLSLDSTTGAVLGWVGPHAAVTLRHLLSFTSGLPPNANCTLAVQLELAACVQQIAALPQVAAAGSRFDYGSTHMHVAARMAEVVTGSNWNDVVATQLQGPLQLADPLVTYTLPRLRTGVSNPLAAGGMVTDVRSYATVLSLLLQAGAHDGNALIAPALIAEMMRQPYPEAVIGAAPTITRELSFRYGLGAWLECATPAGGCAVASSPGAFGWTPWVDIDAGYLAIVAMEGAADEAIVRFSVELAQDLQPLIRAALED